MEVDVPSLVQPPSSVAVDNAPTIPNNDSGLHSQTQLNPPPNSGSSTPPSPQHECNDDGASPNHLSCSCGSNTGSPNSPKNSFSISQRLRANKRRAFRRDSQTQFAFYESIVPSSSSYSDSEEEDYSYTNNSGRRTSTTVILCKKDDGWLWSQESFFPSYMRDKYSCSLSSGDGLVPTNEVFGDDDGGVGRMDEDEQITVEEIVVTEEEVDWFRT